MKAAPSTPRAQATPPSAGLEAALPAQLQADAAALGWTLPADTAHTLAAYQALLAKWNAAYNLTALRDPAQMRTQHLADCLAVVPPLRRHAAARGAASALRVLDVGSGGGLPGVVLAAVEPTWHVTCVDTVGKKAAFVRQAAGELGLPQLSAAHARVESLDLLPFDVVTSRAFASLRDFVQLTRHLLAPGGVWMAMKGKRPDDEMAALPADVEMFHVEPLVVPGLDAERCLVWMRRR